VSFAIGDRYFEILFVRPAECEGRVPEQIAGLFNNTGKITLSSEQKSSPYFFLNFTANRSSRTRRTRSVEMVACVRQGFIDLSRTLPMQQLMSPTCTRYGFC